MDVLMNLKLVVAVLLIAAVPVNAQAQSRRVSKGTAADGVPNWDVSSSGRAAAKVAYAEHASEREKSCMESENKTRDKLAADWATFPAADRARCIGSVKWFSPTYTELATCLEMQGYLRN